MFGPSVHPLIDFVVVALGIVLGFLFANDPRGPLARHSLLTRYVAIFVVAYFVHSVLFRVFGLLGPLVNGVNNAQSVLQFLGGVLLAGGLVAAYVVMRGDLKIQIQRGSVEPDSWRSPPTATAATNGAVGGRRCPQCSHPLKAEAEFCSNCGSRVEALA